MSDGAFLGNRVCLDCPRLHDRPEAPVVPETQPAALPCSLTLGLFMPSGENGADHVDQCLEYSNLCVMLSHLLPLTLREAGATQRQQHHVGASTFDSHLPASALSGDLGHFSSCCTVPPSLSWASAKIIAAVSSMSSLNQIFPLEVNLQCSIQCRHIFCRAHISV